MNAIKIENLRKQFGKVVAIKRLSLEMPTGMVICIIGPNGSGKTTLLNLISGITLFDSGLISIGKHTNLKRIRPFDLFDYSLGRTFQETRIFNQMTVMDNILTAYSGKNIFHLLTELWNKNDYRKARKILSKFDLWKKKDNLAKDLSFGQKKILELIRVMAANPKVYLLDEPLAGLFPKAVKAMLSAIKDLKKEGKTIIMVEHNIGSVSEIANYAFVLNEGRLLAQGKIKDVLKNKEVIKSYLGN